MGSGGGSGGGSSTSTTTASIAPELQPLFSSTGSIVQGAQATVPQVQGPGFSFGLVPQVGGGFNPSQFSVSAGTGFTTQPSLFQEIPASSPPSLPEHITTPFLITQAGGGPSGPGGETELQSLNVIATDPRSPPERQQQARERLNFLQSGGVSFPAGSNIVGPFTGIEGTKHSLSNYQGIFSFMVIEEIRFDGLKVIQFGLKGHFFPNYRESRYPIPTLFSALIFSVEQPLDLTLLL